MDEVSVIIGRNLRRIRTDRGMTPRQVDRAVGASRGTTNRWENGRTSPTGYFVLQLARVLHCTTDELYGHEIQKEEHTNE